MTSLDVESLYWTDEISLRQFIDQYKRSSLPQLLRTTSGYTDADSVNDIGADEVSQSCYIVTSASKSVVAACQSM